jgi:rfaE bifunctional protein nucleotidyltransferase chain/domain
VFDLLHPGHIKHFQAAKAFGDILVVSLTEDKYVNKGPGRPVFDENLRAETISAMSVVDYVTINRHPTAITAIEIIKPDFYIKGQDYKNISDDFSGGIIEEKDKVEQYGGKLVFTEEIQFSSSKLINTYLNHQNEQLQNYLSDIKNHTSFDKIKEDFENIANFKVLVIGDIILDEYQFVLPVGKSSKAATITSKILDRELYAGGVLAVANHIADFVSEVNLISTYGINSGINYLSFIEEKLHSKINFSGLFTPDRPTTLKRRFIDRVFKHKLFEVMEINDKPLPEDLKRELINKVNESASIYDLIVVADFGHGLIDDDIIHCLSNTGKFLAVNTQTNSANTGFNFLTKYQKCDYFAIDKEEARLATHDKYSPVEILATQLANSVNATLGAITLGVDGSLICHHSKNEVITAPILSQEVVDTIGAGDAFLSITSLLAKNKNSIEEIAFIGNVVGAMAVKILGNKSYIEKVPLLKYIKTLLS